MVDTKGNEYSSGNFLKTVAPDLYKRSWGRLEDPPDGLLKVGLTSRNRIQASRYAAYQGNHAILPRPNERH